MRDIVDRLRAAFDANAVCHCGDLCKDHGLAAEHAPVWMQDEDTKMFDDAEREIRQLRRERDALLLVHTARERGVLLDRDEPDGKRVWRVCLDADKGRWREFDAPASHLGVPCLSDWLELSLKLAIEEVPIA